MLASPPLRRLYAVFDLKTKIGMLALSPPPDVPPLESKLNIILQICEQELGMSITMESWTYKHVIHTLNSNLQNIWRHFCNKTCWVLIKLF